jgi:hypothetical protein
MSKKNKIENACKWFEKSYGKRIKEYPVNSDRYDDDHIFLYRVGVDSDEEEDDEKIEEE